MGKATTKDVFNLIVTSFSSINNSKLLQVSPDVPNVNLSFLDVLEDDRKDRELSQLVNNGTCGLHAWHNYMKYDENSSA